VFVLIVDLHVKPEMRAPFLDAVRENSIASVRDEPGCLRFDVISDNADPDHFFFYEVYVDEAAFEAHRNTPHFPRWRAAAAVCLRDVDGQRNTYGTTVFPSDYS